MKRNFIAGLLTGLCGALFVFTVLGAVLVFVSNQEETAKSENIAAAENKVTTAGSNTVEAAEKEEEIPYEDIVNKLSYLEMLVDNYFLEDVDSEEFADGIYKGFIDSLDDPYSTYYTAEEYEALMESSSGVYCGIGATVSQNVNTGIISVVKPFKDSPANKAGILPGDIIYKVEGEEVSGLDLSEVVSRLKGVEGTKVKVTMFRQSEGEYIDFTITRAKIEVPTIEWQMLDKKIGYVVITEFDEITVTQFNTAIKELQADGMKGLIVDVRDNPGGLLDSVVEILDRILPPELIVYTEDKYGNREEEKADDTKKLTIPMAVLINGNSASASEIFAGTLKDYKVATIVGTTSFGKGIVQKVIPLSDGTAVKLTISKYYTPSGNNIHKVGITPDVEVELDEALKQEITIPMDKDNQLQEAIDVILEKMNKTKK